MNPWIDNHRYISSHKFLFLIMIISTWQSSRLEVFFIHIIIKLNYLLIISRNMVDYNWAELSHPFWAEFRRPLREYGGALKNYWLDKSWLWLHLYLSLLTVRGVRLANNNNNNNTIFRSGLSYLFDAEYHYCILYCCTTATSTLPLGAAH